MQRTTRFHSIKNEMSDFPTYARISLTKYPQIKEHYHKVDGGEMFGAMVAMAEGLIEEILEGFYSKQDSFRFRYFFQRKRRSQAPSCLVIQILEIGRIYSGRTDTSD